MQYSQQVNPQHIASLCWLVVAGEHPQIQNSNHGPESVAGSTLSDSTDIRNHTGVGLTHLFTERTISRKDQI